VPGRSWGAISPPQNWTRHSSATTRGPAKWRTWSKVTSIAASMWLRQQRPTRAYLDQHREAANLLTNTCEISGCGNVMHLANAYSSSALSVHRCPAKHQAPNRPSHPEPGTFPSPLTPARTPEARKQTPSDGARKVRPALQRHKLLQHCEPGATPTHHARFQCNQETSDTGTTQ